MRCTASRQLIWQALASAAALAARRHRAGSAAGGERRHHLACRTCGKTAAISEPALERWATAAGRERDLTSLARHLFAACPDCGASARAQPQGVQPREGR